MNFHKDSVFYKVANNRIISLQKSWNFTQIGRRYQTASYLYKSVTVCTFCSQFFYFSPEEVEAFKQNSEQDEKHSSTDIVEKQILNVSTIVQVCLILFLFYVSNCSVHFIFDQKL